MNKVYLKLKMVIVLFLILNILGCASISMAVKDKVPKGMPKGCVKFYHLTYDFATQEIGLQSEIYRIENNENIFEGRTSNWGFAKETGFMLSLSPGEYDFLVTTGTAEAEVRVQVEENKMTPVRISYPSYSTSTKYINRQMLTVKEFTMLLMAEPIQVIQK